MDKKYWMAGLGGDRIDAGGTVDIRFVSWITFEKFEQAETKITRIVKLSREESLYNVVKLNYKDIKDTIEATVNFPEHIVTGYDMLDLYNNLNRLVLNFLASVRTYLDHTQTMLNRSYGKESDEFKSFKKLTGNLFDSKFSYRFLEDLRNYAQHCGFPTGEILLDSNIKNGTVTHTLNLNVVRDDLINNYSKWHKLVKEDLPLQRDKFDLIPLINEKYVDLDKLNREISRSRYVHYKEDAEFLLELMKESSAEGGFPCLIEEEELTSNGGKIAPLYFPYKEIERILDITIEFNSLNAQ